MMSGEQQFGADMYEDEDAALKAAMALSLVTAETDDARRKEKYGIIKPTLAKESGGGTGRGAQVQLPKYGAGGGSAKSGTSVPSTQAQGPHRPPLPSYIARPRPQPGKTPVTMDAFGMQPVTSAAVSGTTDRAPNLPTRGDPQKRSQKGAPPLPSVGPNAKTGSNTMELVPAAIPPPQRSPRLSRSEKTNPVHIEPKSKSPIRKDLITLSPPEASKKAGLFDFDLHSLDPLFSKSSIHQSNVSTKPLPQNGGVGGSPKNPTPAQNQGFGFNNDPFGGNIQMPGQAQAGFATFGRQTSLSGASSALVPVSSSALSRSSPTTVNMRPPSGAPGSVASGTRSSLQGTSGAGVQSGRSVSTVVQPIGFPRVGSGSNLPVLSSSAPSSAGNVPAMPLSLPLTSTPSTTAGLTTPTSAIAQYKPSNTCLSGSGASTPAFSGGDLMDFTDMNELSDDFLRLESFDPLYTMDQHSGANELNDSLFFEKGIQKAIEYSKQSDQAEATSIAQDADSEDSDPDYELMDPFSVSDLTSALELKRKQHEEEKGKRESILRKKKEQLEKSSEAVSATQERRERLSRRNSHMARGREHTYETLQEFHETADEEIRAFCQMVARLKKQYMHDDVVANKGLVISPQLRHPPYRDMSIKLTVHTSLISEPVVFTCDLTILVEHVISQVLMNVTEDEMGSMSTDDYLIKVHGLTEYFLNDTVLGSYEYVQHCLKLDEEVKLIMVEMKNTPKSLMRTVEDDRQPVFVPKAREYEDKDTKVTRDKLNILMETFYKEVEKLRDQALQNGCGKVQCKSVIQAVKAVCAVMYKIETIDIIKAVQKLQAVTIEKTLRPASSSDREAFVYVTEEGEAVGGVVDSEIKRLSEIDDLHIALEELTQSVKCMIELYCRTFHTDFRFESATNIVRDKKSLCAVQENLIVHLASLHRIPLKWRNSYEEFKVIVGLYHRGCRLCEEVTTQMKPSASEGSFQETMIWDEWVQFEDVILSALPREARLTFTLVGVRVINSGSEGGQKVNTPLGWVAQQVFNHKFELVQGRQLLGLWLGEKAYPTGTVLSNIESLNSVLIQVNLPDFDCDIYFPPIENSAPSLKQDFATLHPADQDILNAIISKDSITRLTSEECEFLWEKRHYLCGDSNALAKVLLSCPSWHHTTLQETYTMIQDWTKLPPVLAMELLLPSFADTHVQMMAVTWIRELSDDELLDYLPQLIQALKFQSYHNSSLARFLLERSVTNLRIAHQLYWYLKEAAEDVRHRKRYQLMFGALLSVAGLAMRTEFSKQEDLVRMLGAIAEKVKAAKEKEAVLQRELDNMFDFLQQESIRLPLTPSMEIDGVDTKSCSYFTSNAFPLKLVLRNIDRRAEPIYTMFKVGDDLRQDMLTMQLIRVMDKLWLRHGLDLKIITFRCQATGHKKGLVELVTESETLRKIQMKHGHGLAGSFKDRPIAEWLQVQNPTELEYQKAVDNFVASCAGYCVATYVLGICDRHNDNIMIKHSGHMFHIDFGKFLGDSQMFGNIKRDRTPFVLTSDMAYVINGGDKPSHKFQTFVDLCCQAFNIIRRHKSLFLNLFSMMVNSGIPGVDYQAGKYVQRALLPDHSDTEATAFFTRMIEESLKSVFTQINFFFHNLAQIKFSGHAEGALLSFIPKTYSLNTDGLIKSVEVFGYQKRYNPEKYYIYIIKVERENQRVPSFIFRRYSEFQELHHKLVLMYPLVKLPSLPGKVLIGRTHVKTVAEARKGEVEKFLRQLLHCASEVAECDLVYTFFHPMLRDEQDIDKTNLQKLKESPSAKTETRSIQGQVKLSLCYKDDTLTVMVMHVKDLCGEAGEVPDPYVKTYLIPDPEKLTKRKTKIAKAAFHPTFNEVLLYRMPYETVSQRTLQVTVWNYKSLEENEFLGAAHIDLCDLDLSMEATRWYALQNLHRVNFGS